MEFKLDLGLLSGGEAPNLSQTASRCEGLLQAAAVGIYDVTHESKNVQEVRLSRGIWA